jgi:ABC-type phosphate transport system substrate-binding protein
MRRQSILVSCLAFAASMALSVPVTAQAGYRLVVNKASTVDSLSRAEVARIFLKKVTTWPGGAPIQVVDQERSAPTRKAFSAAVHQKDADAVAAHWQVLVFSGRDVPPKIVKSDTEVLEFVRANPGAVGYVSGETDLGGVKAVAVRP